MSEKEILKKLDLFVNKERFVKVLFTFIKEEKFLLENDVNERSMTHKLAEHLQKEFTEYNVDCEYNRMFGEAYDKEYITKRLDLNDTGKLDVIVYPDIILHSRGTDLNFLIIEVKKSSTKIEYKKERAFDIKKIKKYIKNLNYTNGIFLEFNEKGISSIELIKS